MLGDHAAAAQAGAAIARRHPGQTEGLRLQAASLIEAGDYPNAAATARRAYEAGDQGAFAILKLAENRTTKTISKPIGFELGAGVGTSDIAGIHFSNARRDNVDAPFKPTQRLRTGVQPPGPNEPNRVETLLPSYALAFFSAHDLEDLAKAVDAVQRATTSLYKKSPNAAVDAISGWSQAGKVSNIMQTVSMVFGGALAYAGIEIEGMQRSCIDHQIALAGPVRESLPPDSRLKVEYINLGGFPWPEHHALLVYPRDTNPVRSGVVLDPWRKQSALPANFVYPYTQWKGHFALETMGGEQSEEVERARR